MATAVTMGLGNFVPIGADLAQADTRRDEAARTVDALEALQLCRREKDTNKRLLCYDDVAAKNAPPDFAGKLGHTTQPFMIDRPHVLRFRSQGVIFVLYVLDEYGHVVQNLHVGGGGEGTYLIEDPGTYSLQIDGSARWQIWLKPA